MPPYIPVQQLEVIAFVVGSLMLLFAFTTVQVRQLKVAPQSKQARLALCVLGIVFVGGSVYFYVTNQPRVPAPRPFNESGQLPVTSQGRFVHEPETSPGKVIQEYYSAVDAKNWAKAWSLLAESKRKEFGDKYQWKDPDTFGREGFRTTLNHEQVLVLEDQRLINDASATVEELLIVTDKLPENPAIELISEKKVGEVLAVSAQEELARAVLRSLEASYEVKLDNNLKQRLKAYVLSQNVGTLLAPDFLEAIALNRDPIVKDTVFPLRQSKSPSSSAQTEPARKITKRIIVNRRDLVKQGKDWLIGNTAEAVAIAVYR